MRSTIWWWSRGPGWTSVGKHKVTAGDARLQNSTQFCGGETRVNTQLPLAHPANCLWFLSAHPSAWNKDKSLFCSAGSGYGEREIDELCPLHQICIVAVDFRRKYKHPSSTSSSPVLWILQKQLLLDVFVLCTAAAHLNNVIIMSNLSHHGSH